MPIKITDTISDLPTDIFEKIVCLLSSRDVMRLSVLSRSWRKVCSSLSCLTVDVQRDGWHCLNFKDDETLKKFVKSMLCHYNTSNLHTFRFICVEPGIMNHIFIISSEPYMGNFNRFVLAEVAKFNPRIVYLDIPMNRAEYFSCIFTWKSVEELYLTHQLINGFLPTPQVVTRPNLKKMHMIDAKISRKSLNNVLLCCPLIEELSLKNCTILGTFIISNTTLKRLVVDRCCCASLSIFACNLVSMEIHEVGLFHTTFVNFSSLVYARINHLVGYYPSGFFSDLSAVQYLDLCMERDLKAVLDEVLTKLPKFENMKSLSLNGWCMACHSLAVERFLENSPKLEKLTVFLNMHNCLVKSKKNHGNLRRIKAPRCKGLKMLVITVSQRYKRAYGSGMAFLKVVKDINPAKIVLRKS